MNFVKLLSTHFLQNTSGRLLLLIETVEDDNVVFIPIYIYPFTYDFSQDIDALLAVWPHNWDSSHGQYLQVIFIQAKCNSSFHSTLSEAATGGLLQKVFLEILQNSKENTSARACFLTETQ